MSPVVGQLRHITNRIWAKRVGQIGLAAVAALAVAAAMPAPAGADDHHGGGSWHGGGGSWHGGGAWHHDHDHFHHFHNNFGVGVLFPTYGYGWDGYPDAPYGDAYAAPSYSWYYCANPAGYYPYVQQCTVPWQPVPPQPPG